MTSLRRVLVLLGLLISAAWVGGTGNSASAYPQDPNNCNDRTMSYSFHDSGSGGAWTSTQKAWVTEAFNVLTSFKGQNTVQLLWLNKRPDNSSADVKLYIRNLSGTAIGTSECNPPQATLAIDDSVKNNRRVVRYVASHELLHLAGAEHGGQGDSWYNLNRSSLAPTRTSTCVSLTSHYDAAIPSFDDFAYLNWLHGSGPWRQMMADTGMETYWDDVWIHYNGLQHYFSTSTSGEGSRHMRIRPTNWNSATNQSTHVQQNVRILNGDDNEQYRGVVRAREETSSYWSGIYLERWWRALDFTGGSNGCSYADGLSSTDPNQNPSGLWQKEADHYSSLNTTWTEIMTPWFNPPSADAYDMALRLRGFSVSGSARGWIYLDNFSMVGT